MARQRRIDTDGHILEPQDLWEKNLPQRFRERGIRIQMEGGIEQLLLDRQVVVAGLLGAFGCIDAPIEKRFDPTLHYSDGHPAGFDGHKRLEVMDNDGYDVSLLYPTLGILVAGMQDAELAQAHCQVYNDWLIQEYCAADPTRLYAHALVNMVDPELARQELVRAVKLGARAVFMRPNCIAGRPPTDPAYDRFYATVQDLDIPIGIHPFPTADLVNQGDVNRYAHNLDPFFPMVTGFPIDHMLLLTSLVADGFWEKFPRIRWSFIESGGGWIAHWLNRMDSKYKWFGFLNPRIKQKPSQYFKEHCVIGFDPDDKLLRPMMDAVGEDYVTWCSDFPHIDAPYPNTMKELDEATASLSATARAKVEGANAERIYRLDA